MAGGAEITRRIVIQAVGETAKLDAALNASGRKIDDFKRRNQDAAGGATNLGSRYATAARTIASGSETIARTGKLGGEAMKQLITQGSLAATFFGPTGAVVGAVGISVLAIVHLFNRASDSARETRQAIQAEYQKLATLESVTSAAREAERIQRGTSRAPLTEAGRRVFDARRQELRDDKDAKTFGDEFGLQAVREEIAAIEKRRLAGESLGLAGVRWRDALIEKEKELAKLHGEAIAQITRLGQVEAQRAQADARADARKDAGDDAKKTAEQLAKDKATFDDRFTKVLLSSTATLVDDLKAEYDDLITEARRLGKTTEVATLEDLRREAVATQVALEQAAEQLATIDRTAKSAADEYLKIDEVIAGLHGQLRQTTAGSAQRKRIEAEIERLYARQQVLLKEMRDEDEKRATASERIQKAVKETAIALAKSVGAALQLAAAFGVADDNLRNVGQLLEGLGRVASGDVLGGGVQAASGFVSLLGGGDEPRRFRERMQAELNAWNAALDEWVASIREHGAELSSIAEHERQSADDLDKWLRRRSEIAAAALREQGGDVEQALRRLRGLTQTSPIKDAIRALEQYSAAVAENAEATRDATAAAEERVVSLRERLARAEGNETLAEQIARDRELAGATPFEQEILRRIFAAEDTNRNVERTSGTMSVVSRATEMQFDRSLALDQTRNAYLATIVAILSQGAGAPITPPALPSAFAPAGAASSPSITIGDITINVSGAIANDPRVLGEELYRELTRRLAEEQRTWDRHRGVVS